MEGWISIHRKIKESSWYKDSEYVHLWIHLLLSAAYKDMDVKLIKSNKVVHLKRGQLIVSRSTLADAVHINENKIYRILKCFENEQQIEQQKNSHYTLITILNYDYYQQNEQQNCCSLNNKRTASEQQVNTYNKYNNNIYILLLNKYKANPPKNTLEKLKKIREIKNSKEFKSLDKNLQLELFAECTGG